MVFEIGEEASCHQLNSRANGLCECIVGGRDGQSRQGQNLTNWNRGDKGDEMTRPSDVDNFTPLFSGVIQDTGLIAASVFGRMWRYAQKSGVCQASKETIAGELGLSVRTVIRYQQTLCENGYMVDATPNLRNRPHTYTMTDKASTVTESHSTVTESHTAMTESHSHYDRESLEERKKREDKREKTTPDGGSQESQSDVEMFFGGDVPETPSGNGEKPHMESLDPLTHMVEQARRRDDGEIPWLLPGTPCGDHDYLEPFKAFCEAIDRRPRSVDEKMTKNWLKQLEAISTAQSIADPAVMAMAIGVMVDREWGFQKRVWKTPFSKGFVEAIGIVADQIESGQLTAGESWSGALS